MKMEENNQVGRPIKDIEKGEKRRPVTISMTQDIEETLRSEAAGKKFTLPDLIAAIAKEFKDGQHQLAKENATLGVRVDDLRREVSRLEKLNDKLEARLKPAPKEKKEKKQKKKAWLSEWLNVATKNKGFGMNGLVDGWVKEGQRKGFGVSRDELVEPATKELEK